MGRLDHEIPQYWRSYKACIFSQLLCFSPYPSPSTRVLDSCKIQLLGTLFCLLEDIATTRRLVCTCCHSGALVLLFVLLRFTPVCQPAQRPVQILCVFRAGTELSLVSLLLLSVPEGAATVTLGSYVRLLFPRKQEEFPGPKSRYGSS